MKKYMSCILVVMFVSIAASAQYRNHRYNNRYYSYDRYPARTSVSVIARLPIGAISVGFGNRYYHYHNGIYYRPYYGGGYMIVRPPIGIIVPSLPIGYTSIIIGTHNYYRYEDVYYAPFGNRYKVVEEPVEDEIAPDAKTEKSSSDEYEKVILEGKTYYKKGEKYYKASVNANGEITYEEVGEKSKSE